MFLSTQNNNNTELKEQVLTKWSLMFSMIEEVLKYFKCWTMDPQYLPLKYTVVKYKVGYN